MASKAKSRWADSEEDLAHAAKLKQEKEEKRRLKAEKARRLEEERQAKLAAAAAQPGHDDGSNGAGERPAKRRKLTPERAGPKDDARDDSSSGGPKLLRFEGGQWGKCRSVENYDKLNDIEEGTYGWVARAKEIATGKVVALKRLKIDKNDRNGLPVTGLREIQTLKDCEHRNIVKMQEVVVGDSSDKADRYMSPPARYRSSANHACQEHISRPRVHRA